MVVSVGVLAVQGAFIEHVTMLKSLGIKAVEIRLPADLEGLDGIILPGGESTTIAKVAHRWGLIEPLREWVESSKPIWGTCAGMILLSSHARNMKDGGQELIGGMNVEVSRNFFGSQIRSFEMMINSPPESKNAEDDFNAFFIRAPAIVSVGEGVEVLSTIKYPKPEEESLVDVIVAAKQGNILVTSFHPELSQDNRWHQYFIDNFVSK